MTPLTWSAIRMLIEAWVYEINAQQAHYAYLLKRRKALGAPEPEKDEVRT